MPKFLIQLQSQTRPNKRTWTWKSEKQMQIYILRAFAHTYRLCGDISGYHRENFRVFHIGAIVFVPSPWQNIGSREFARQNALFFTVHVTLFDVRIQRSNMHVLKVRNHLLAASTWLEHLK